MEPPSPNLILDISIIAACLVAVAILSGAESSFISVNKIRIRSLMDSGDKRAKAVQAILDEHDRLFSAVILSGNLFTVMATSLGTALTLRLVGVEYGVIVATLLMTSLTVVFGELAPKTFAVTHSEKLSLFLARPMQLYIKLLSPLIWIFHMSSNTILKFFGVKDKPASPFVTEEEIKAMINIGEEEGTIEEDEKRLLHRIFEFGDTEVSEAMIPRTEMVTINIDDPVTDVLQLVSDKGFARYLVVKEDADDVQGILYIKDILSTMAQTSVEELSAGNLMRDAFYIPENKMVTELLDDMQKKKLHIAIVMDEYGGTAGLVTLEDLMEEIVGGLQDEFEEIEAVKDVQIIDERTFIVQGYAPLDETSEMLGVDIENEDFNTVGGLVFGLFGRMPKIGEQVQTKGLSFLVLEMEERKIGKLKITKL
jgi:putative hemolysin